MSEKRVTIRVPEETLALYKNWLKKRGYRSINQHLNLVIRKIATREKRAEEVNENKD